MRRVVYSAQVQGIPIAGRDNDAPGSRNRDRTRHRMNGSSRTRVHHIVSRLIVLRASPNHRITQGLIFKRLGQKGKKSEWTDIIPICPFPHRYYALSGKILLPVHRIMSYQANARANLIKDSMTQFFVWGKFKRFSLLQASYDVGN